MCHPGAVAPSLHDAAQRLVAGVQGMVARMPGSYEVRFALVGSSAGEGIAPAVLAYGDLLQAAHGTSPHYSSSSSSSSNLDASDATPDADDDPNANTTKLTLADDPLSRQVHSCHRSSPHTSHLTLPPSHTSSHATLLSR